MKRRGVRETDPYDWEKLDQTSNANMANIAGNNMQIDIIDKNEQQIHGNNITQMTVAGSNASGHEYVSISFVFFSFLNQKCVYNVELRSIFVVCSMSVKFYIFLITTHIFFQAVLC